MQWVPLPEQPFSQRFSARPRPPQAKPDEVPDSIRVKLVPLIDDFRGGSTPGIAAKVFSAIPEVTIHMISQGASEINISFVIDEADVPQAVSQLHKAFFSTVDPEVFAWYIKNYGPSVNLFVDHSQIVQLECSRRGIWGTSELWGRIVTYRP